MRFRFTRNLAIYVALSNLKARERFADEYPDDVAGFEKRMGGYLAQCVGFLALAAKLSPLELDKVPEAVEKFRSLNLEAYEELRLVLARIMLYSLRIPKLRQGSYFPPFLEARKVSEKAWIAVVQEAWIGGVSTRRVDDLVQAKAKRDQQVASFQALQRHR